MKTQSKKKGCSCSLFYYARNREFQFFWRKTVLKRTSNAIQYSAWRKLTWMNCNWKGKLQVTLLSVYVSWNKLCSHTFKASSEELTWCFLRKKRQNTWRTMCERVFSVNLQVGLSQLKINFFQKQPSRGVPWKRCSKQSVAKQLYWNLTSAWAFFCKFAASFQNTFF